MKSECFSGLAQIGSFAPLRQRKTPGGDKKERLEILRVLTLCGLIVGVLNGVRHVQRA